jgi:hypothetical protein
MVSLRVLENTVVCCFGLTRFAKTSKQLDQFEIFYVTDWLDSVLCSNIFLFCIFYIG